MIEGQQIPDGEVLWKVCKFFKEDDTQYPTIDQVYSILNQVYHEIGRRVKSREYELGKIVHHSSNIDLECIEEGTSSDESNITVTNDEIGTIIEDGTVKWLVLDALDGTPVGHLGWDYSVRPGYLKANGATINREDYPRLVNYVNKYNLWTSTSDTSPGLFGVGDGTSTMILPDFRGSMIKLADSGSGTLIEAGLPNITGSAKWDFMGYTDLGFYSGAFKRSGSSPTTGITEGGSAAERGYPILFDASKSNEIYGKSDTVQPQAITMIPVIRY